MDDGYQFLGCEIFSGVVATGGGCFCRIPLAVQVGAHVVSDLKLLCVVHLLPG